VVVQSSEENEQQQEEERPGLEKEFACLRWRLQRNEHEKDKGQGSSSPWARFCPPAAAPKLSLDWPFAFACLQRMLLRPPVPFFGPLVPDSMVEWTNTAIIAG